jgi:hypothetical protein
MATLITVTVTLVTITIVGGGTLPLGSHHRNLQHKSWRLEIYGAGEGKRSRVKSNPGRCSTRIARDCFSGMVKSTWKAHLKIHSFQVRNTEMTLFISSTVYDK